jgi:hypothetical protein
MTNENPEVVIRDREQNYTKLLTKIKRGTGTRDQDTTKLTTKHADPEVAAKRHQKAIESVRASAKAARTIETGDNNE